MCNSDSYFSCCVYRAKCNAWLGASVQWVYFVCPVFFPLHHIGSLNLIFGGAMGSGWVRQITTKVYFDYKFLLDRNSKYLASCDIIIFSFLSHAFSYSLSNGCVKLPTSSAQKNNIKFLFGIWNKKLWIKYEECVSLITWIYLDQSWPWLAWFGDYSEAGLGTGKVVDGSEF